MEENHYCGEEDQENEDQAGGNCSPDIENECEDILKQDIIDTVKGFPLLYDTYHKDYKNEKLKNQYWESIGINLALEYSGPEVKTMFNKIKQNRSYHKKIYNDRLKANSGGDRDSVPKPAWKFWDATQFLEGTTRTRISKKGAAKLVHSCAPVENSKRVLKPSIQPPAKKSPMLQTSFRNQQQQRQIQQVQDEVWEKLQQQQQRSPTMSSCSTASNLQYCSVSVSPEKVMTTQVITLEQLQQDLASVEHDLPMKGMPQTSTLFTRNSSSPSGANLQVLQSPLVPPVWSNSNSQTKTPAAKESDQQLERSTPRTSRARRDTSSFYEDHSLSQAVVGASEAVTSIATAMRQHRAAPNDEMVCATGRWISSQLKKLPEVPREEISFKIMEFAMNEIRQFRCLEDF